MEGRLELMVKYLVHLQFYSEEEDVLYSRDKRSQISIPGIKFTIDAFIDELTRSLSLVKAGEYHAYLEEIAKTLAIDIDQIESEFRANIREVPKHELGDELVVNFLVGPVRAELQSKAFETCIELAVRQAIARFQNPNMEPVIRDRLLDIYSKNDPCVSMLYNLSLLRLLSSIYGTHDVYDRVNKLVGKYCDDLVDKLAG